MCLVSEEMNLCEALILNPRQRIGFIPTSWEDVEGDFSSNRVGEAVGVEFLLEHSYELLSYTSFLKYLRSVERRKC